MRELLVLLPGMMCDHRLFAPQVERFKDRYNVVVGNVSNGDSIAENASELLASLPKGPLNLAGLSMGGIIAMAMVDQAPSRIMRLALMDTNFQADAAQRFDVRNRQIEAVRNGQLRQVIVDEMKPNYMAKVNRGNQQLLDLLIDMAMDLGSATFINQSIALRERMDHTEALRKYLGPALVLCGEEDSLCPVSMHEDMDAILPNSMMKLIPDAGHITTLENPEAVNLALEEWLLRPAKGEE